MDLSDVKVCGMTTVEVLVMGVCSIPFERKSSITVVLPESKPSNSSRSNCPHGKGGYVTFNIII